MLYCLVIESLIYVMVSTRPNIADGIGVMNKSMSNPRKNIDKPWSGFLGF